MIKVEMIMQEQREILMRLQEQERMIKELGEVIPKRVKD